ncbi:MAG: response regulator transcription factor [Proteobacteria bacterium]|nr:response regulator transcription factor [Pseudomonadota bacterium]
MRLLLAEDDRMIGRSLVRGLEDAGYSVDWVQDAPSAEHALQDKASLYVAAVIDIGLPGGSGLSVIETMRGRGDPLPVIVVTAADAIGDRVRGLDIGADDYLPKPFAMEELLARLRSVLRRPPRRAGNTLRVGALELDPVRREARLHGDPVELGTREFALLYALMDHPGAVLSRAQLEERIYGWDHGVDSNAVEVIIHKLRRKLGKDSIENVRGAGWRIGAIP